MQPLSAIRLLDAWEEGTGRSVVERMLILLHVASPEIPIETLAALPVGEGNSRLLVIREQVLGPTIIGVSMCPECGERLEISFAVDEILPPAEVGIEHEVTLLCREYAVVFRLPTGTDLAAIEGMDVESAYLALVGRCMVSAARNGDVVKAEDLPPEVVVELGERMEAADPLADVELACSCTACGHKWPMTFDIPSFFWAELAAWAEHLLYDVHLIASVYGWDERAILSMSPRRRAYYLEMIAG